MATPKQAHSLTSYFVSKYKERYDRDPRVNRNTARWSWDGMLEDLSVEDINVLIDYYFTTASGTTHSLEWFFYNYEKLIESKDAVDKDKAEVELLREESRLRTAAWKEKNGIND